MLLDELITVIETLKQRITDHGAILQDNETRTRMALIDPLLHVLGWDTTGPGRRSHGVAAPNTSPTPLAWSRIHTCESRGTHKMPIPPLDPVQSALKLLQDGGQQS